MKKYILLTFSILIIFTVVFKMYNNNNQDKDFLKCDLSVYRFEKDFFSINKDSFEIKFPLIKNKYPEFFLDNSIDFKNDVFLDDTLVAVLDSVNLVFGDVLPEIETIKNGFCNYQHYFPGETLSVYTFIDKSFDYRTPVVFSDSKLFVSLHLFLGSDHSFYSFLPDYIKYSHDVTFLPASCFITLAGKHIPYPDVSNFLETMLYYSKAYVFAQKMLPETPHYKLFKCSEEKIEWCYNNESSIWNYMIERDYLFSSSLDLIDNFISLAPFSQFGLPTDRDSPGGVGLWLGMQIWDSYMENNSISLLEVLNETDYMKVLNNSGYKP